MKGKVALVTGGARNIGRAISLALGEAGAAVMVNANTSKAGAEEVAAAIRAKGGRAAVHIADVTDPAAVSGLVDATVKEFGRLDCLVNNAALRMNADFADIRYEDWKKVLAVALDAAFLCTQAALPHLAKSGAGTVVMLGGLTGHKGASGRAHVVTAKAGLVGLTKALALDLAPQNITVNCVVPGTIDTERGLPGAPAHPAGRHAVSPLGRLGRPDEVAAMVRMLCGPDARYITGQSIHVSGGGYMP